MDRLALLLQFYEEDPADAFTRFAIAQEYLKRDEPDKAVAFFEALQRDEPSYSGTYYHLGKLYERLGRNDDAIATYEQGIQISQQQRNLKDLSELQGALLQAQGLGFDDDDD